MIDWIQAFWLALIQGITEFLPISSSGHLALMPSVFDWQDQGLVFDVAVHIGTFIAVAYYFRNDIKQLINDWLQFLTTRKHTEYSRLAWYIGIATIFVACAGLIFDDFIEANLRSPVVIGLTTLIFGILLGLSDIKGQKNRSLDTITWKDAAVIGLAQTLALIPGTSRSGITITAGLLLGLNREAAARFSFLLAIPVLFLATLWQIKNLAEAHQTIDFSILLFAVAVSAIVAFLCIHYFLRFIKRFSMIPFMIYRIFLGTFILYYTIFYNSHID